MERRKHTPSLPSLKSTSYWLCAKKKRGLRKRFVGPKSKGGSKKDYLEGFWLPNIKREKIILKMKFRTLGRPEQKFKGRGEDLTSLGDFRT